MLSPYDAANMARYPTVSGIRNDEPRDAATRERENALYTSVVQQARTPH